LCDAYTKEVIHEESYEKPDMILHLIKQARDNLGNAFDAVVIDNNLFLAEYVSHSMTYEGKIALYRVFFKLKLPEKQVKVKS
jgi:hypothetical protein